MIDIRPNSITGWLAGYRLAAGPKRGFALVALVLLAAAMLSGCQVALRSTPGAAAPTPQVSDAPPADAGSPSEINSYLLLNQRWVEGLSEKGLDLENVDEVFWHVFSRLPGEVTVYPSENYYYFILFVDSRQFWGNIRLPADSRDRGVLSFAYFEFDEFPSGPSTRFTRSKFFTDRDGLLIDKLDPFAYRVSYNGKQVVFNLHKLSQEPPQLFSLAEGEVFVERTFDESGYQFFLLFNERKNYFFWVLNEEEGLTDVLDPVEEDLLVGRRSGFAFWVDGERGGRKVLMGVRNLNVSRNDYYDGPFDQLADNYVDQTRISEYMVRASPSLEGRIDKFGYYTDREQPLRVSLSNYFTYYTVADLGRIIEQAKASEDVYQFISRRGFPVEASPTPSPSPAAP